MISCFHGNYFSLSTLIDTSIIQINKNCVREMILKIEQETQYSLPLRREKIYSGVLFEFSQFKQLTLYCIVLLHCIERELVNCDILLHSLFKNLKNVTNQWNGCGGTVQSTWRCRYQYSATYEQTLSNKFHYFSITFWIMYLINIRILDNPHKNVLLMRRV